MQNKPQIIAVSGTYPDLGKGILTASLSYLLTENGYTVFPIKFDGYMNYSSGTMNPYHKSMDSKYSEEEVFVLEDGYEADADSGYYERFTHRTFYNKSTITNGRLFALVSEMERTGLLRHGEVLNYRFVRGVLAKWILEEAEKYDFVVLEIGGTIGDKESEILYDTLNILKSQQKIALYTIMMSPYLSRGDITDTSLEMSYRSKITRQGFEKSWRLGIVPNAIVMRTTQKDVILQNDLDYIALETGLIDQKSVYVDSDLNSIYELPNLLHKQGFEKNILAYFGLTLHPEKKTNRLENYVLSLQAVKSMDRELVIGILGKTVSDDSYVSLKEAVEHAGVFLNRRVEIFWLDDCRDFESELTHIHALIIGEGLSKVSEKMIALRFAREHQLPCLAISFGCDLMVKEYAECILAITVGLDELNESGKFRIRKTKLQNGSISIGLTHPIHYQTLPFNERVRFNSLIEGDLEAMFSDSDFQISGSDIVTKKPILFELRSNPFYVGCKFHPEFISHPGCPHALFTKLIQYCNDEKGGE